MKLKQVKRSDLTTALQDAKDRFKADVFFVTALRATKDNSLQVEVCQNRLLSGRKRTMLGSLNRSDSRFRGATTLLFNWMKVEPSDFFKVFPTLTEQKDPLTPENLAEIAKSWDPNGETGTDATVYQSLFEIPYVYDSEFDAKATPVIAVTEITESELLNYGFYKGTNADEKIKNELENGRAVMRTGAGDDAEDIVDPETGDRIFRFTRVVYKEDYPKGDYDKIIPNKVSKSTYDRTSKVPHMNISNDLNVPELEKQEDQI